MNVFSGKKLPWFPVDEIYHISNNLTSAVYAFAACDQKPSEKSWPFFTEEVFYVGMTGGRECDFIFDRKNKNNKKGRFQTSVHRRMKEHNYKTGKLKHEWVEQKISEGKKIFVCMVLPPENYQAVDVRNWLMTVESETKFYYQMIYGSLPILNFAEQGNISSKLIKEDSISQREVRNLKTIDSFI
jgi:hypothetical protein